MKKFILGFVFISIITSNLIVYGKIITTDDYARSAWGNIEEAEVTIKEISENLFLLYGVGGNVAVLIGEDGVLLVDDQIPLIFPKLKEAIKELSNGKIVYTINTHWHWDHADGNLALDFKETKIISHSNARENMSKGGLINMGDSSLYQEPYPINALPVITHDNGMTLYFNDERIDIVNFGPAHTTGDSLIIFNKHNAIHFGDVFFTNSYPFIDVDNGGSIDGMIGFLEKSILRMNSDTIVMPGHGNLATLQDVKETINMLKIVRKRILNLIKQGKSLEEVIDSEPTNGFDNKYGESMLITFVNRVYTSLKNNN